MTGIHNGAGSRYSLNRWKLSFMLAFLTVWTAAAGPTVPALNCSKASWRMRFFSRRAFTKVSLSSQLCGLVSGPCWRTALISSSEAEVVDIEAPPVRFSGVTVTGTVLQYDVWRVPFWGKSANHAEVQDKLDTRKFWSRPPSGYPTAWGSLDIPLL